MPAFLGESHFNAQGYALNAARTADRRELDYVRMTGASTDAAKEVKVFGLNGFLMDRYQVLALEMQAENRRLLLRRAAWGGGLAALGTVGYYAAYAYLAWRTLTGGFSIGDLTFLAGSFLRLRGLLEGLLGGFSSMASQAMYLEDLYSFFRIQPGIQSVPGALPFPAALAAGIRVRGRGIPLPGVGAVGGAGAVVLAAGRGDAGAGGGERGGQDDTHKTADPAIRPDRGPHPAGGAGPARVRCCRACAAGWGSSSRTSCATT